MMQASTTATTLTHRAAAAAPLRAPSCRRRAVAAVLHARAVAAPERLTTTGRPARQHAHQRQRQQVQWQQALLGEMQQAYVADAEGNNSNAHNPSATSSSCAAGAGRLESLLDEVYEAIDEVFYSKGGFKIPPAERKLIDATGGSSSYGEIEASGIDQLLRYLAMDSDSVFVDLGCGRGRALLQVAAHSPAAACVGLELSDTRLEQAHMALEQLQDRGVALRPVSLHHADLSTCSLEQGTHFYLCSTAFGAGICRSIAQRLAASPRFQVLVTSRQLPTQPFLHKLGEVPCAFSYSAAGAAHIYVKSLRHARPALLARLWCRDGVCALPGMSELQLGVAEDRMVAAEGEAASRFVRLSSASQGAAGLQPSQQQPSQQREGEE